MHLSNEKFHILINIWLKFEWKLSSKSVSIQVMAWHQKDKKPLPKSMIAKFYVAMWYHRATSLKQSDAYMH